MILWLDDLREPSKNGYAGARWAKTAQEAIGLLATRQVTFASLDHDLSVDATMGMPVEVEETGYYVLCWLEEHPEFWPRNGVRVHSVNQRGVAMMLAAIRRHYRRDFQRVEAAGGRDGKDSGVEAEDRTGHKDL